MNPKHAGVNAIFGKRRARVVQKLSARLNADDVQRPGLQRRERPTPVMARNVQDALASKITYIPLNDCGMPCIQPVRYRTGVTRGVEPRILIKESHMQPIPVQN